MDEREILPDLPASVRRRVLGMAIRCRFRPRQALFRAGDPADGLYLVLSGRVLVSRETAQHVELLHSEGPGGVLGEIPVFGGGSYPATAVATELTHCLKLPKEAVSRLLGEEPDFVRYSLMRMAKRAQSLLNRIDELTATTIEARVAGRILEIATDDPFRIGMSQAALAREIGTAREVVVRAIRSLVENGALRRVGRAQFSVSNWQTLRRVAREAR